jgi:hypothetical protein
MDREETSWRMGACVSLALEFFWITMNIFIPHYEPLTLCHFGGFEVAVVWHLNHEAFFS